MYLYVYIYIYKHTYIYVYIYIYVHIWTRKKIVLLYSTPLDNLGSDSGVAELSIPQGCGAIPLAYHTRELSTEATFLRDLYIRQTVFT